MGYFKEVQEQVTEWHRDTFPNATEEAMKRKLEEETVELLEALFSKKENRDAIVEELADVVIVASSLFNRWGVNLEMAVLKKLEVNKARAWGPEIANGDRPRVK